MQSVRWVAMVATVLIGGAAAAQVTPNPRWTAEQQEVVDHPLHAEVLVGDVGRDRSEYVRVLVAERSARTS